MPGGSSTIRRRLVCPDCGSDLPTPDQTAGETVELHCDGCGGTFRARRRSSRSGEFPAAPAPVAPPVGGIDLIGRSVALGMLRGAYHVGTIGFTTLLLSCGGFVPVLRRWLDDDLTQWGQVVETLGGVCVSVASRDPDGDLGPAIIRVDAPRLFEEVDSVSRAPRGETSRTDSGYLSAMLRSGCLEAVACVVTGIATPAHLDRRRAACRARA